MCMFMYEYVYACVYVCVNNSNKYIMQKITKTAVSTVMPPLHWRRQVRYARGAAEFW